MSSIGTALSKIENAIRAVYSVLEQRDRLTCSWLGMSDDCLWRELVACILGSRVRFDLAHAAIERLNETRLLSPPCHDSAHDEYEQAVCDVLLGTYPYPRLRAHQIRMAAQSLYSDGNSRSIYDLLSNTQDVKVVRDRLAVEVPGLGPKQASLFLRNIGYSEDIAVLDVHVLRYMHWVGVTPNSVKSVRAMWQYEALERTFLEYSWTRGFRPHYFDMAIWVVVRAVRKERGCRE